MAFVFVIVRSRQWGPYTVFNKHIKKKKKNWNAGSSEVAFSNFGSKKNGVFNTCFHRWTLASMPPKN
jgi:hypothetical protein